MARILHIADLHLDAPLTANLTLKEAAVRRSEQLETFSRIMAAAVGRADVVLIAGDLFDGENVRRETLSVIRRGFRSLGGIPVFISPGNHDPYPVYENLELGENVRVFPAEGGVCDLEEHRMRICGAGFASRHGAPRIGPSEFEKHEEYTNILLLHGDISGAPGSERYNPLSTNDFRGFDYAALGHIHRHGGINEGGGSVWAYPGIPEPGGFDEGEGGGYIFGDVTRGAASLEHVPTAKRGYRVYELSQDEPAADNESLISLASSRVMSGGEGGIVRIILKGRTKSGFRPDVGLIKDRLRGLCFSVDVRDETEPELDLTADENDGGLRAVYIRIMRKKALAFPAGSRERKTAERALRLGVEAMEGGKGA